MRKDGTDVEKIDPPPPAGTAGLRITEPTATITINCADAAHCSSLRLAILDRSGAVMTPLSPLPSSTAAQKVYEIPSAGLPSGVQLRLARNGTPFKLYPISSADEASQQDQQTVQTQLADVVGKMCRPDAEAFNVDPYTNHTAVFVVNQLGNVWLRPGENIDEGDLVRVTVVAPAEMIATMRVRRASAFRQPGEIRIVGDEIAPQLIRHAKDAAAKCAELSVELRDFSPGRGEVEILVNTTQGEQRTGSFDFGVNTLYHGAFSVGFVASWLTDPKFGRAFNGQDTIVTITEDPEDADARVLYTLMYTPFIPRRDIEKEGFRISPAAGLVLNDLSDNFLIGAAVDISASIYGTLGAHLGRVRELDPNADLQTGDVFPGSAGEIPVVKRWDVGFFLGATVDVRAMVKMLRLALAPAASP